MNCDTSGKERFRASRRIVDFNKQLLFGEVGALLGVVLSPYLVSRITRNPTTISGSAVIGGLVTGSLFWLMVKIGDESERGRFSARPLARQIAWFTPAAFLLGLLTYQPVLFFASRWLIVDGHKVVSAALLSQGLAFLVFLLAMNLYRLILHRLTAEWL